MTDKLEIKKSDLLITKNTIKKIKNYLDCNGLIDLAFDKTIQAVNLILQEGKQDDR
jgi:hypothetical protein